MTSDHSFYKQRAEGREQRARPHGDSVPHGSLTRQRRNTIRNVPWQTLGSPVARSRGLWIVFLHWRRQASMHKRRFSYENTEEARSLKKKTSRSFRPVRSIKSFGLALCSPLSALCSLLLRSCNPGSSDRNLCRPNQRSFEASDRCTLR